jgi:Secretion system C-terminal sorting domain
MKPTLFLFILFVFCLTLTKTFSQVTLESTYPTTNLKRLNLPFDGDTWYYADDKQRQLFIHNGQHHLTKVISFPTEINKKVSLAQMNIPISQTIFNKDNLLEIVWLFEDTLSSKKRIKVLNERGDSVLVLSENDIDITVSELVGSQNKLLVKSSGNMFRYSMKIYSLPERVLEKVYSNVSNFRRQRFGYAGERYYFKDSDNKLLELYDANHTRLAPVRLAVPQNGGYTSDYDPYFFADDKIFNADSLIEVIFSYDMRSYEQVRIANERTIVLFHSGFYSSFQIDQKIGQPDKIFWAYAKDFSSNNHYKVLRLPVNLAIYTTFQTEHTYEYPVQRILLSYHGSKYVINPMGTPDLYHSNHTFWKRIPTNENNGYVRTYDSPQFISDAIANLDSIVEIMWLEKNTTTNLYNLRISNEKGQNLASIPNARYFEVSQIPSLPNKLVTKMWNGTKLTETQVYRFNQTTTHTTSVSKDLELQLSPNPFSTHFTIHTSNSDTPLSIRLFNNLGQPVFEKKIEQTPTTIAPPTSLPSGIYMIEVRSGAKKVVKRMVKI